MWPSSHGFLMPCMEAPWFTLTVLELFCGQGAFHLACRRIGQAGVHAIGNCRERASINAVQNWATQHW